MNKLLSEQLGPGKQAAREFDEWRIFSKYRVF
jgi:hypothetical protein